MQESYAQSSGTYNGINTRNKLKGPTKHRWLDTLDWPYQAFLSFSHNAGNVAAIVGHILQTRLPQKAWRKAGFRVKNVLRIVNTGLQKREDTRSGAKRLYTV